MHPKESELRKGRKDLEFLCFMDQIPPCGSTSLATDCKTVAGLCWGKIIILSMSMCELKYITTK